MTFFQSEKSSEIFQVDQQKVAEYGCLLIAGSKFICFLLTGLSKKNVINEQQKQLYFVISN